MLFRSYTSQLPDDIVAIIAHNKRISPKFKYIFYDDNDCEQFIKKHYDDNVYNAFKSINDCYGAMKADFFRYCVLYTIGGVYLDIKSKLNVDLSTIIQPSDTCILDIPRNNLEPWRTNKPTFEQWLLMFAPKHPYLMEMIQQMVYDITRRFEPTIAGYPVLTTKQKILHVTGPDAFTRAIRKSIRKLKVRAHRSIDYNKYFQLHCGNYRKMYVTKKHYSEYTLPLYK